MVNEAIFGWPRGTFVRMKNVAFSRCCVFCSIFRKNGKKLVESISLFVPFVFDFSPIESTTYRWLNLHFFKYTVKTCKTIFIFKVGNILFSSKGLEKKKHYAGI